MKRLTLLIISLTSIFAYSQMAPPQIGSMLCRFYDNGKQITESDSLQKFGIYGAHAIPYIADTVVGGVKMVFQKFDTMNIEVSSYVDTIWVLNKIIRWDSIFYKSGNIASAVYGYMVIQYKTDDSVYVDSMYYQSGYFNLVPLGNTPKLNRDGKRYTQCVLVKQAKSDSLISNFAFIRAKGAGDYSYGNEAWKLARYNYKLALEYKPNDMELKARVEKLDKLINHNK